ncbi:hypothetical protein V6R86_00115 [Sphingomonas kaistensis]|uniref:Uncharacterized protein n=1 Tax=Sphingomonas kaistensis TaxID=298708 RepID=A0ABZ2FWT5_9SPHN
MSDEQLTSFIDGTGGHAANKRLFKDRVAHSDAAFDVAAGAPAAWLAKITAGEHVHPKSAKEAGQIGRALQGIGDAGLADIERLRSIAGDCLDAIAGSRAAAPGSYIRRGIARIDELADRLRQ